MLSQLKELLTFLNDNLDENRILNAERLHQEALCWKKVSRLPIIATYPYPKNVQLQPFPHGQVFDNPEKMLFNQLANAFDASVYLGNEIGDDLPVTIRPDFGCVLIGSMFGAKVEQVENNPPWIRHGNEEISYQKIINTQVNFNDGLIAKVVGRYKFYIDILKDYPRLFEFTNIVLPDLQGPFDNLELLRGSNIFLDMYLQQELFLKAMTVVTDAQIELAKYLGQFVNNRIDGFSFQHGFVLKGEILIRNDTSIMISPQMYDELVSPFDDKILRTFGGGIHSCGCVDKIVPQFASLDSINCFDFGQSELNDIETTYQLASQMRIPLLRVSVTEEDLLTGEILKRYPTGISLIFRAKSFEHAKKVVASYK